jgi:acyl-CoA thioesterase
MYQHDQPVLQVTAAYGDLDGLKGEDWSALKRPDIPPFEDCPVTREQVLEMRQRAEIRMVEGAEVFTRRATTGTGRMTGWTRHTDGADTDTLSLLMFADAFPPPIFTVYGARHWVPTLELTVQVRARPAAGPLQIRLVSRHLTRGVLEEDVELWDSDGKLVAISRQTARLRL